MKVLYKRFKKEKKVNILVFLIKVKILKRIFNLHKIIQ